MSRTMVAAEPLMSLRDFRERFPALRLLTHVDVAARGPISSSVREAAVTHITERLHGTVDKSHWFACQDRVRSRFARLINAASDEEVAITKNVSEGLNAVASAMPWRAGDTVVICSQFEHPNNIYPWAHLARLGVELVDVPMTQRALPVDDIIAALRPTTRIVSVASISFFSGLRADLEALGRACRARDILLLVDAAQSVGVMHTDVQRDNIDALAVSTQKGLCGLYGLGFLYVRRAWAERLVPAYLARFGVDLGEAHEADYATGKSLRLAPGARRFEVGNPNFTGIAAVDAALTDLLAVGTGQIEQHVLALAAKLINGLLQIGLPVENGDPRGRSHIVTMGGTRDFAASPLHDWLHGKDVRLSVRRGMLRLSLHGYNDESDIERILALCAKWQARVQSRI